MASGVRRITISYALGVAEFLHLNARPLTSTPSYKRNRHHCYHRRIIVVLSLRRRCRLILVAQRTSNAVGVKKPLLLEQHGLHNYRVGSLRTSLLGSFDNPFFALLL